MTAVPETQQKKQKAMAQRAALKQMKSKILSKRRRELRITATRRAEKYAAEYKRMERSEINQKRHAKSQGNFFMPPEPKIAFVVRIRGINAVSPRVKKILQLLRLRQIHNGVFVRLNSATIKMLRLVENYVSYGYPNLKTVRELVYKRGFGKVRGQRIPLFDNSVVSANLSKHGVNCVEDIIHEIYTCGPNFKAANNFMWPFKLSSPKGGFKTITKPFIEGGDAGNREQYINKLAQRMN